MRALHFMEIVKTQLADALELRIKGRLDSYWSDHLSNSIEESIHAGAHKIQLNLAGVDYLSSAGIRVLLKYYKQLLGIKGSLKVTHPSEGAAAIIELSGLSSALIATDVSSAPAAAPVAEKPAEPARFESESTVFHVYDVAPGSSMKCTLVGDPSKLDGGGYVEADCHTQSYPASTFGLGLGAFGSNFSDCKDRFGEFLAIEGVGTYLPTDGTHVPDYVMSEGLLVPELEVLYGLTGKGSYAQLIRFEAKPEPPGLITLGELVEQALNLSQADTAAFAILAETAGLVGAALKRSPFNPGAGVESPLSFPAVRDWLSFTTERAFERSVCLIVGVASRKGESPLASMLRPIGPDTTALGHFHAAAFPYRPLQRGELSLINSVTALFSTEALQGILHLLADDREMDGVGQSEFLRGACWISPISEVTKV